jgi:hypothetical protein
VGNGMARTAGNSYTVRQKKDISTYAIMKLDFYSFIYLSLIKIRRSSTLAAFNFLIIEFYYGHNFLPLFVQVLKSESTLHTLRRKNRPDEFVNSCYFEH